MFRYFEKTKKNFLINLMFHSKFKKSLEIFSSFWSLLRILELYWGCSLSTPRKNKIRTNIFWSCMKTFAKLLMTSRRYFQTFSLLDRLKVWKISRQIVRDSDSFTGYSLWDQPHNFLHKFTRIVLSLHKLNKLGKFW